MTETLQRRLGREGVGPREAAESGAELEPLLTFLLDKKAARGTFEKAEQGQRIPNKSS